MSDYITDNMTRLMDGQQQYLPARMLPLTPSRPLSKKPSPSSNALSVNTARFCLRFSVCQPFPLPKSNAFSIRFQLRLNVRVLSPPTPGSIIHQKTHITFFFSIQLPSPAASLALFIVFGILHPQSPSSTISASTTSITQI